MTDHPANTKTLSQRWMIGYIDVDSSLEMKVPPMSVNKVMASHFEATLYQRNANVVTTLQSRNFIKCLTTSF